MKGPGLGLNHKPPSIAQVKESVELYFYSFVSSCAVIERTLLYLMSCNVAMCNLIPAYQGFG